MAELLVFVVALGLLAWAVVGFVSVRRRRVRPRAAWGRLALSATVLVGGALLLDARRTPEERARLDRAPSAAAPVQTAPTPAVAAAVPDPAPDPVPPPAEPEPEPVRAPEPVASAPSVRSDAQNLAIIAGRDPDDPEIAARLARLDAVCPDEGPTAGDMVVSLQQLVKRESGREMDIVEVMDQLYTAQEGPAQAMGMNCSETGGMLATLLIKER